ncbi:MAG: hypothetical protein V4805_06805 [Pseudomonadota bacterium]
MSAYQVVDESWTEHPGRFDRMTVAGVALRDCKLECYIGKMPPLVAHCVIE